MTLTPRQPRPLTRDAASLRDDRLFIVACDDTYAPKQYFNLFRLPRVQVYVVPTPDGTSAASHVLDRLLRVDHDPDDELWMLLDTDHCVQGSHLASFTAALSEAKRQRVNVAFAGPRSSCGYFCITSKRLRRDAFRPQETSKWPSVPRSDNTTRPSSKSRTILWRRCATRASGPSGWTPRSLALTF